MDSFDSRRWLWMSAILSLGGCGPGSGNESGAADNADGSTANSMDESDATGDDTPTSAGDTTDGDATGEETTGEETTGEETTGGETTDGETTGGEATGGETTDGDTTDGDTTGGDTTDGDTSGDDGPGCSALEDVNAFDGFAVEGESCRILGLVGDITDDGKSEYVVELGHPGATREWGVVLGKSDRTAVDGPAAAVSEIWHTDSGWHAGPSAAGGVDFDGDGIGDFIWTPATDLNPPGRVIVFGAASGALASSDLNPWVRGIAAGDFDGDGLTDAALSFGPEDWMLPPTPFVVFGDTSREFATYEEALAGTGGFVLTNCQYGVSPRPLGDFNGDGMDEFTVTPTSQGSTFGIFGSEDRDALDCSQIVEDGRGFEFAESPDWRFRSVGDIDDDGFDDILVGGRIVRGHDVGTTLDVATAAGYDVSPEVMVGEFNDDGIPDLYYAHPTWASVTVVFGGSWFTSFTPDAPPVDHSMVLTFAEPHTGGILGVGDVNGDGCDDFALRAQSSDQNHCGYVRFTPNSP